MKSLIVGTLLLLLIMPLTLWGQSNTLLDPAPKVLDSKPYAPLTRAEAKAWMQSITIEQLEDFVIRYDTVEHAVPSLGKFDYVAIVTGKDVYVKPLIPTVPLTIGVGPNELSYTLDLPTFTYKDLIVQPRTFWRDAGIGALVTLAATITIYLLASHGGK